MKRLFACLVIISSVVAIEENFIKYQQLCNSWKVEELESLIKDRGSNLDECDFSIGFTFNTKFCQSFEGFEPETWFEDNSMNFSAFLSDNDHYLYVYVNPDLKLENYKQSVKVVQPFDLGIIGDNFLTAMTSVLFVVWIKEKRISKSSHSYIIDYKYEESGKTVEKSVTEKLSTQTDQQLILKGLNNLTANNKFSISISYTSETSSNISDKITIRDSYVIICGRKKGDTFHSINCEPLEENQRIRCKCSDESIHLVVFVAGLFWICLVIIMIRPAIEMVIEDEESERTSFNILYNCSEKSFKYKYILVLRLAKSSTGFDLKKVTIDVEFFTDNNDSVAPNFRFKAKVLESRPVTDIKLIMFRLTKLPELKQIQCNHSGTTEGKICLLGLYKQCIIVPNNSKKSKEVDQWFRAVKNISRHQRRFNLRSIPEDQEVTCVEAPLNKLKLTQITFSINELIFILFIDISFMALVSAYIQFNSITKIFAQMLTSVVVTTLLGIGFNFSLFLSYKYLLLREMRQKIQMNRQNENRYFIIIRVIYGVCIAITMVFTYFTVNIRTNDTGIVIFRWISVIFCSTTLMTAVWYVFTYWEVWFYPKRKSESTDLTVNSASINESMLY